jgi:hypothetical protein
MVGYGHSEPEVDVKPHAHQSVDRFAFFPWAVHVPLTECILVVCLVVEMLWRLKRRASAI